MSLRFFLWVWVPFVTQGTGDLPNGLYRVNGNLKMGDKQSPFKALVSFARTPQGKPLTITPTDCGDIPGCTPGMSIEAGIPQGKSSPKESAVTSGKYNTTSQGNAAGQSTGNSAGQSTSKITSNAGSYKRTLVIMSAFLAFLSTFVGAGAGVGGRGLAVSIGASLLVALAASISLDQAHQGTWNWDCFLPEWVGEANPGKSCTAGLEIEANGGTISGRINYYGRSVDINGAIQEHFMVPEWFRGEKWGDAQGSTLMIDSTKIGGVDVKHLVSASFWGDKGDNGGYIRVGLASGEEKTLRTSGQTVQTSTGKKKIMTMDDKTFFEDGCPNGMCPPTPAVTVADATSFGLHWVLCVMACGLLS